MAIQYFHPADPPSTQGLTLEDWFAGQVLLGIMANPSINTGHTYLKVKFSEEEIAMKVCDVAYDLANAMMTRRDL